jgi:hypothetical protein
MLLFRLATDQAPLGSTDSYPSVDIYNLLENEKTEAANCAASGFLRKI